MRRRPKAPVPFDRLVKRPGVSPLCDLVIRFIVVGIILLHREMQLKVEGYSLNGATKGLSSLVATISLRKTNLI